MSDSEGSDVCSLLVQALPVSDIDVNDPPTCEKALTSPDEYLKFVRYQAASFPSVICSQDLTISSAIDQTITSQLEITESNNHKKWKTCEISSTKNYKRVKCFISEYQCLKSLVLQSPDEMIKTSIPLTKATILEYSPSLTWIAQLSRSEIMILVDTAASLCKKKHWNYKLSVWIFSLLVALEPPFHPDLCHNLRTIAKRCQKLKRDIKQQSSISSPPVTAAGTTTTTTIDDEDVTQDLKFFDLFINLISHVFGQSDLADSLID
ncbi:unnamed protein product [Heterobilharzia americana]|nr:unnamed protein product [Heterobilharzia americana]